MKLAGDGTSATSGDPAHQQPRRVDLFTSPLFVAALTTLVLNDWLFKQLFPGAITGKLSDGAGLVAFTLFWLAIFPRHRALVAIVVAAAFAAWKHPLLQPAIDLWNAHAPFRIGRTPDWTDLAALPAILLAVHYATRLRPRTTKFVPTTLLILASVIAFGATSYRTTFEYDTGYVYTGTPAEFVAALAERAITVYADPDAQSTAPTHYALNIPATVCFDSIDAEVAVSAYDNLTRVKLVSLTHRCPENRGDKALLYRIFSEAVVGPLNLRAATF